MFSSRQPARQAVLAAARQTQFDFGSYTARWPPAPMRLPCTLTCLAISRPDGIGLRPNTWRCCRLPLIRRHCVQMRCRSRLTLTWLWRMQVPPVRCPYPRPLHFRVFRRPQRYRGRPNHLLLFIRILPLPARPNRGALPKVRNRMGSTRGTASGNPRGMETGAGEAAETEN